MGSTAIGISLATDDARVTARVIGTLSPLCSRWHFPLVCGEPPHTSSGLPAKAGGGLWGKIFWHCQSMLEIGRRPWSPLWIRAAFWSSDAEVKGSITDSQSLEPSGSLSLFYLSQVLRMLRPCSGVMAFQIKSTANLDYATMKQKNTRCNAESPSQLKLSDDTYGCRWLKGFRGNSRWMGK